MTSERLTAFTDGVIAVIITIMVLEMRAPRGAELADLAALWPVFASYVLSFVYLGIYWNNHHHFFRLAPRVTGPVLWANLHLLFWLSLVPFTTAWLGEHAFAPMPSAFYGLSLLACAIAWYIMQLALFRAKGPNLALKRAVGRDLKGKLSPFLYLAGIGLSFIAPLLAYALYAAVAAMWLLPDRRVEAAVIHSESEG
ncbi:MAG: hypothetical protein JWO25_428 [Alphaproteobacteria bacterium]|nr:hypothetical protein [Alphaproteobacteria bacterium]MDB5721878.1 hypothetical protein [Alphaproteobacteria bacterium]